jgi:carboxyl-terminal processing protease
MLHKSKLLVFIGSVIIVLYGTSAAFYGKVAAKEDAYKEISVFIDVLNKVEDDYVEVPDMRKLQDGTMQGLMDALDPYSSFLSGERYDAIEKRNETGNAESGMILSKRSDVIYVISCNPGSPAAQAGIRPGDYVVAVNGKQVEGESVLEVSSYLRGAPGTKLSLEIFRSSGSKTLNPELTLQVPSSESLTSSIVDGNIGLLKIASLKNASTEQIGDQLKVLIGKGAEKIALDLRDCADGSPAAGAALANFFLHDGVIYYSRNQAGEKIDVVEAEPAKFLTDMPLAVLINGSTASAAEIAAGALKDRNRATIVGEKSFGVGSSQKTIRLKSGAVLVLTTAKFCTPGGQVIQDETARNAGITPNLIVPDSDTRQDLVVDSYYEDQDEGEKYKQLMLKIEQLQMKKALEVLQDAKMPAEQAA